MFDCRPGNCFSKVCDLQCQALIQLVCAIAHLQRAAAELWVVYHELLGLHHGSERRPLEGVDQDEGWGHFRRCFADTDIRPRLKNRVASQARRGRSFASATSLASAIFHPVRLATLARCSAFGAGHCHTSPSSRTELNAARFVQSAGSSAVTTTLLLASCLQCLSPSQEELLCRSRRAQMGGFCHCFRERVFPPSGSARACLLDVSTTSKFRVSKKQQVRVPRHVPAHKEGHVMPPVCAEMHTIKRKSLHTMVLQVFIETLCRGGLNLSVLFVTKNCHFWAFATIMATDVFSLGLCLCPRLQSDDLQSETPLVAGWVRLQTTEQHLVVTPLSTTCWLQREDPADCTRSVNLACQRLLWSGWRFRHLSFTRLKFIWFLWNDMTSVRKFVHLVACSSVPGPVGCDRLLPCRLCFYVLTQLWSDSLDRPTFAWPIFVPDTSSLGLGGWEGGVAEGWGVQGWWWRGGEEGFLVAEIPAWSGHGKIMSVLPACQRAQFHKTTSQCATRTIFARQTVNSAWAKLMDMSSVITYTRKKNHVGMILTDDGMFCTAPEISWCAHLAPACTRCGQPMATRVTVTHNTATHVPTSMIWNVLPFSDPLQSSGRPHWRPIFKPFEFLPWCTTLQLLEGLDQAIFGSRPLKFKTLWLFCVWISCIPTFRLFRAVRCETKRKFWWREAPLEQLKAVPNLTKYTNIRGTWSGKDRCNWSWNLRTWGWTSPRQGVLENDDGDVTPTVLKCRSWDVMKVS